MKRKRILVFPTILLVIITLLSLGVVIYEKVSYLPPDEGTLRFGDQVVELKTASQRVDLLQLPSNDEAYRFRLGDHLLVSMSGKPGETFFNGGWLIKDGDLLETHRTKYRVIQHSFVNYEQVRNSQLWFDDKASLTIYVFHPGDLINYIQATPI